MGRWIWTKYERSDFSNGSLKVIKNYAGLYACGLRVNVDADHSIHVTREIKDDCNIACLTRETRPRSTAENWRTILTTNYESSGNIVTVDGKNHSNRDLAVI
jgi:hypothetical protein